MINNFKQAVDKQVLGGIDSLTSMQQYEYQNLITVKQNLEKKGDKQYYIECLPLDYINRILKFEKMTNTVGAECTIMRVYTNKKNELLVDVKTNDARYKINNWTMRLTTLMASCKFKTVSRKYYVYFKRLSPNNMEYITTRLNAKIESYNKLFHTEQVDAVKVIRKELKENPSNLTITRSALRRTLHSIERDEKEIKDAWNSTLTPEEQIKLLNWLKANVYSMRLYVVKDSSWDKVLTKRYPDEQYGLKRRTEASEASLDHISGYVSVSDIKEAPIEIIKKLTRKVKDEDNFKQNKSSKQYRLNNYLLVLFLLNNYNNIGFKTGVRNLSKYITQ